MRLSRSWKPITQAAATILPIVAGCGPPPEKAQVLRPAVESISVRPTEKPATREPLFTSWLPETGRMTDEMRQRHLAPGFAWTPILTEDFRDASTEVVPGWRIVDFPSLRVDLLDGRKYVEIRGPADMKGPCGLECDLDAAAIAGRDVRLDLYLSCRSVLRLEVAKGIEVTVTGTDAAGQTTTVSIPLEIGMSPGWEWHHAWLRFQPGLRAATLRILAERPVATATVGGVRLFAFEPAWMRQTPSSGPAATQPSEQSAPKPSNWITGGNFETGSSGFYTSATTRWPNGDERVIPMDWRFSEEATEGRTALIVSVPEFGGRVGFGPVNLDRSAMLPPQLYLSFLARSSRPTTVTATLRTRARAMERRTFILTSAWQRFQDTFLIDARQLDDRRELAATELVFDYAGDRAPEVNECGLDAVVLSDSPVTTLGLRSAEVEVGILGPNPTPGDLGHLIDDQAKASVSVKLVGDPAAAPSRRPAASQPTRTLQSPTNARPAGQLAIDVFDAWDRSVAGVTRAASLPPSGITIENLNLEGLSHGYYRIVATLWEGTPGASRMISQAAYPLAMLSWSDAIPKDNPYGLSTSDGNISAATTHLGAGWVRMDLPAKELQTGPTTWGFAAWGALMGTCRANRIDVVTALTLPSEPQARQAFVDQWMADSSLWPCGVLVHRPSISSQPTEAYLAELKWLGERLAQRAPGIRLVTDSLTDGQTGKGVVLGIACPATPLPEDCEKQLEAVGRRQSPDQVVWDPCVPVRLGGTQTIGKSTLALSPNGRGAVQLLDGPIDPVLSASRMVRSLLIRSLAAAQLSCSEAVALAPVRSVFENDQYRLHEQDLSPRPALVAFDLLTETLNNAVLKRWVDVPGGTRVLYFESADGRAIAAVWRPFGLSPTRLGMEGLGPSVEAVDCTGAVEPVVTEGTLRVIEANEIVRFLIAGDQDRPALQQALRDIRVLTPNQSQPAR